MGRAQLALCCAVLMVSLCSKVSAERGEAVFSLDAPSTSIEIDLSLLCGQQAPSTQALPTLAFSCDMRQLFFGASVQTLSDTISFTTFANYGPTIARRLRMGLGQFFNIAHRPGYFTELNTMIGPFVEYAPCGWFILSHSFFYLNKLSLIDIGGGETFRLTDNSLEADLALFFFPIPPLKIALRVATFDDHTFNLICSPIFSATMSYTFARGRLLNGRLRKTQSNSFLCEVGLKAMCEYIDFFVLSGNLRRSVFTIFTRVAL